MPKPVGITKQHILSAIEYIDKNGVPAKNDAPVHTFEHKGKAYPSVYVIKLAESYRLNNRVVETLPDCGDSNDANDILAKQGFAIIKKSAQSKSDEEKFKALLEWFVKQLRINNNIETGKHTSGRGCEGNQIRSLYAKWREYSDFSLDATVQPGWQGHTSGSNFIHYSWVNINPIFEKINNDKYEVSSLKICVKPNKQLQKEGTEINIDTLGLFDGATPNQSLRDFWEEFKKEVLEYKRNNEAQDAGLVKDNPQKPTISKNTILYGPPGTGKTYHTAIYAVAICDPDNATLDELKEKAKTKEGYEEIYEKYQGLIDNGRVKFTTFHQSYGYEDFIEGIKPEIDDKGNIVYKVKPGVFKQFCCDNNDDSQNKVFIIDEINRGNISKIFGELITLIEDDKRGTTYVTLPLSPDEKFTVPEKVYILGTMNTADRSIALMDTALRRRFTFVEMMPEPKIFVKNGVDVVIDDVNIRLLLEAMNERIEYLYDREHTIGHAYFKEFIDGEGSISDLRATFKNKIIPLLQEYFYDDYEKIALVLNDDNASDKFIKTKNVPAEWLGKQYDEGDKYDINPEIWNEKVDFSARLRAIYEKKQKNQVEETGE